MRSLKASILLLCCRQLQPRLQWSFEQGWRTDGKESIHWHKCFRLSQRRPFGLVDRIPTHVLLAVLLLWSYCAIDMRGWKFNFVVNKQLHCFLFWAATKQLYEWSICSYVCLSICLSVTPFSLCSHHHIIMKFSEVITIDRSDAHAKGQMQEVKGQFSRFQTVAPVWIHIWRWNDAQSLMCHRRGALLFCQGHQWNFKVTCNKKIPIFIWIEHF